MSSVLKGRFLSLMLFVFFLGKTDSKTTNSTTNVEEDTASLLQQWPPGHIQRCVILFGADVDNFEVLPGHGWDNLQNLELGEVVHFQYFQCKMTSDRRYLIPDSVSVTPNKQSSLQVFADWTSSMAEYKSATSFSINGDASASLGIGDLSIGGSFSAGYSTAKQKMSETTDVKRISTIQTVYNRYTATLQPDAPLHPNFKKRLMDIAQSFQFNDTRTGRYLAQLLVRDYGTHILTSVQAGAKLFREDIITINTSTTNEEKIRGLKLNAGLSVSALFATDTVQTDGSIAGAYGNGDASSKTSSFAKSVSDSSIKTYGGADYSLSSTAGEWADSLDDNLVAIDRTGQPIYDLVTPLSLPDLPESTFRELEQSVRMAYNAYYKFNLYRGCMDHTKNNFDVKANVDDDTCKQKDSDTVTFGGVYQVCSPILSKNGNACEVDGGYDHKNPLTGEYSCPSGFTPSELFTTTIEKPGTKRECSGTFLWKKCHDVGLLSTASYTAYWCSLQPEVSSGHHVFGGMYSSSRPNPLTGKQSCPKNFRALKLGSDIGVCFSNSSDSNDVGIKFGGMFSCRRGNPLALFLNKNVSMANDSLARSQYDRGQWPISCPPRFSRHLVTIENDCEVEYCSVAFKQTDRSKQALPQLRRPPFMKTPQPMIYSDSNLMIISANDSWSSNEIAYQEMVRMENITKTLSGFQEASTALDSALSFALKSGQSPDTGDMSLIHLGDVNISSDIDSSKIGRQRAGNSDKHREAYMPQSTVAAVSAAATRGCVAMATLFYLVVRRQFSKKAKSRLLLNGPSPILDSDASVETHASYGAF